MRLSENYKDHMDLLEQKFTILKNANADFTIKNMAGKSAHDLFLSSKSTAILDFD